MVSPCRTLRTPPIAPVSPAPPSPPASPFLLAALAALAAPVPPQLAARVACRHAVATWVLALAAVLSVATTATGAAGPSPETTALPLHSRPYEETRGLLPPRFLEYGTNRFVILSDAEPAWTREQAQRLERTHHQFLRFARRLGLRLEPLEHRLVCVLFRSRAQYLAFARAQDGVIDPWIAGYYAPASDRTVFYQGQANPSVVDARARLREMQGELEAIGTEASTARRQGLARRADALEEHRQAYRRHLREEEVRIDAFAEEVSTATVVHEAVHHLMFHTGVQSHRFTWPIWISEGIATAFETDETDRAFGPGHEHAARREAFTVVLTEGRAIDLDRLITWTKITETDEETLRIAYLQSYALVSWLNRFRRPALRTYLDLLRSEPPGEKSRARHRALFEQAFGSVDDLEHAWLKIERSRVTAPPVPPTSASPATPRRAD